MTRDGAIIRREAVALKPVPSGPLTDVKVLATGRAAGILIDATVIAG